jgi:hypothetical protein
VALGGLVPRVAGRPSYARLRRVLTASARRAALGWAQAEARAASIFLMEGEDRCGMCHGVRKGSARDGDDDIAPVQVPRTWLPHADFSHRSHTPSDCNICHAAITVFDPAASPEVPRPSWAERQSTPYGLLTPDELAREDPGLTPSDAASDVSIPDLDACRTCHLGPDAPTGFIASECALCHRFHRRLPAIGSASAGARQPAGLR